MVKNKVPYDICTLDVVFVAIKRFEEPWIVFCDEVSGAGIRPKFVFTNESGLKGEAQSLYKATY